MQGGDWARFFSTTRGCGAANPPLPAARQNHSAAGMLLAALLAEMPEGGPATQFNQSSTAQCLTLAEGLAGLAPSVKHSVHCRQHRSVIRPGSSCPLDCGPHCQAPALLGLLLKRLGSSMAGVRSVATPGWVDCWGPSAS